ncbi:MAG: Asp-tRNA(Asn)/Glu-tRNA(Gln) amidotransferase subunit GatC, partial [Chloroflexi bacterium]|nr:Asp-tRNA(Asn)/Glu-tRNA(Gln) amidotransferase subunit GatC [Chloroflexota bacterium]
FRPSTQTVTRDTLPLTQRYPAVALRSDPGESAPMSDSPDADATQFTSEQVRHLASLVRIELTETEVEEFRSELASILSHIDALSEVDTEGVPPTNNGADLLNVQDDDASEPAMPLEEVLANAPQREDDYFRVHAVLDQS